MELEIFEILLPISPVPAYINLVSMNIAITLWW